jgi:hypothetical protein
VGAIMAGVVVIALETVLVTITAVLGTLIVLVVEISIGALLFEINISRRIQNLITNRGFIQNKSREVNLSQTMIVHYKVHVVRKCPHV